MIKKISTNLLLGALAAGLMTVPCYASTQQKIQEGQSAKAQSQKELNNTQSRIESLEAKKGDLESYLTELNRQLTELGENLKDIEERSQEKAEELERLQKELAQAKEREAEQYESMKLRIQYMYENSSDSYITLLLESKNLTELLEQTENIVQMTKYDRKMLEEYKDTAKEIADKEQSIEKESQELETLKEESLAKQDEVTLVVKSTKGEISSYEAEITSAQSKEQSLLTQIAGQEEHINQLIKKQKDEEAAVQLAKQEAEEMAARPVSQSSAGTAQNAPSQAEQENTQADKVEEAAETPVQETGSSSSEGTYLGTFTLTAYCNGPCCGGHASGLTASGTVPQQGRTVAMGGVPFGTKLLINGNVYVVEDRGVPYGHVDIYFDSHADAMAFGRGSAEVYQLP